jgi:hypothetical protein
MEMHLMIEHVENYQFGFFAPGSHIQPDPDIIGKLLTALKDKGLIPTTAQELHIAPKTVMRLQLQFTSPLGEWTLAFLPDRVLLKKQNVTATEIGSPEDFCWQAEDIFVRLLGTVTLVGNRLSYITNGLLPEMSAGQLAQANKRLMNLPAFYIRYSPREWTTRNSARVDLRLGEKDETVNVITIVKRVRGRLSDEAGPIPFDRIQVGFDINTVQEVTAQRFGPDSIKVFLAKALELSREITGQVEGMLHECIDD